MILIAAVGKNIAARLSLFQSFYKTLKKELPSIELFFYENDSTDGTAEMLRQWSQENAEVHVRTERWNISEFLEKSRARAWDNKSCRMECIAEARNRLAAWIETERPHFGESQEDLLIVIDPDFPQEPPVEPLIHWLRNFPPQASALLANGLAQVGAKYFDAFSYRDALTPFGDEILGETEEKAIRFQQIQKKIDFSEPARAVFSSFGGMAIYRAYCVKGLRYSAVPTASLDKLYRRIVAENPQHPAVRLALAKPKTHHEGSLLGAYLFGGPEEGGIWYRNNSGYNFPVLCEHVPFHAAMIERGFGGLFLMPSLVYISDHFA